MWNNFVTLSQWTNSQFHYIRRQYSHVVIRICNTSWACGLTELAARCGCLRKNYNDRVCKIANGVLCGLTSSKNTGYKQRQVFDVVHIETAYTTAAVMLWKFEQMCSLYCISNIILSKGNTDKISCELAKYKRTQECQYDGSVDCKCIHGWKLGISATTVP